MKILMEILGGILLSLAVVLSLVNINSNVSLPNGTTGTVNLLGEAATVETIDTSTFTDKVATENYALRECPQVTCNISHASDIQIGSEVNLLSYLKIKVANDNNWYLATDGLTGAATFTIKVEDIQCVTDTDLNVIDKYNASTGVIIFDKSGVYSLKMKVTDADRKSSTVVIKIPVNEIEVNAEG